LDIFFNLIKDIFLETVEKEEPAINVTMMKNIINRLMCPPREVCGFVQVMVRL